MYFSILRNFLLSFLNICSKEGKEKEQLPLYLEETRKTIANRKTKNAAAKAKKQKISTFEKAIEPIKKKNKTTKDKDETPVLKLWSPIKVPAIMLVMYFEKTDALKQPPKRKCPKTNRVEQASKETIMENISEEPEH